MGILLRCQRQDMRLSVFEERNWKNMEINIAVIPGDGIGPEIVDAAEQVLMRVCEIYGHVLNITHVKACSSSIEETGNLFQKSL